MDGSETNMSSEDIKDSLATSVKPKPKKRSLVERELETSLTARVTSPLTNSDGASTSRYGRTRRLKTDSDYCDTDKAVTTVLKSPKYEKTPVKTSPVVYRMHASNSPVRIDGIKVGTPDTLENQIESIYKTNISMSRFGSEEKGSPAKKFTKMYIRKDLIQSKEKDIEDTVTLIKDLFSPEKSQKPYNSHVNNILERSSEKYCNGTASKSQKSQNMSVVKILDFDSNKKRKDNRETKVLSKSEIFELEAKCLFQVGDLAWARMGTYPFWPCIITRDPYSDMFVKTKLFGLKEREVIHVTFFGDNGRRSWILDSMLRAFLGREEFEATRDQFTPEAKKKDPRLYAAFFISDKKQSLWMKSIAEADTLAKEPKRLRIDLLYDMLGKTSIRQTPKSQKSGKITRTDSDVSLSETLYDSLFSEKDGKVEEEKVGSKKNKSLDVSDVVTACLDNMAAKTGMTMIQRQSHMDIWLQKAKSKTPEKVTLKTTITVEKVNEKGRTLTEKETKRDKEPKRKDSRKKKRFENYVPNMKPYTLRKSTNESHTLLSHHNEHDYSSKIDDKSEESESNSQYESSVKHSGNETDISSTTTNNDSQISEVESQKLEVSLTVTQDESSMDVDQSIIDTQEIENTDKLEEKSKDLIEIANEISECAVVVIAAKDLETPDNTSVMEIDAIESNKTIDNQIANVAIEDAVITSESNDDKTSQTNTSLDESSMNEKSQENNNTLQSTIDKMEDETKQESTDSKKQQKNKITNKICDKITKTSRRSSARRSAKIDQLIENADFQPKEFKIVIDKTDIEKFEYKSHALTLLNRKCVLNNVNDKETISDVHDFLTTEINGIDNLLPSDKTSENPTDIKATNQEHTKKGDTHVANENISKNDETATTTGKDNEISVVNIKIVALVEAQTEGAIKNEKTFEISTDIEAINQELTKTGDTHVATENISKNYETATTVEKNNEISVENNDIVALVEAQIEAAIQNDEIYLLQSIVFERNSKVVDKIDEVNAMQIKSEVNAMEIKSEVTDENVATDTVTESFATENTDVEEVDTEIASKNSCKDTKDSQNIDKSDQPSKNHSYKVVDVEITSAVKAVKEVNETKEQTPTTDLSSSAVENQINNEDRSDGIPRKTNDSDINIETAPNRKASVESKADHESEINSEDFKIKVDLDAEDTVIGKRRVIADVVENNISENDKIDGTLTFTPTQSLAKGTEPIVNGYHKDTVSAKIKELLDSDTASLNSELDDITLDELKRRTSKIDENLDNLTIESFKPDTVAKKMYRRLRSCQSPIVKENGFADSRDSSVERVVKKEVDIDTISINSEDSTASTKRKGRKDNSEDKMKNPEFLRYLEMRQDALIDENPELTQEEIVDYLYKTWIYEENLKSDVKKTDEFVQSNLVKGLGSDYVKPKKASKSKATSKLIDIEKVMSKESKKDKRVSSIENVPREKPKRKIIQPYYNENFSDIEDELEVFEIFKMKPKVTPKPIEATMAPEVGDDSNKVESTVKDETPVAEEIPQEEFYDEVEAYFEQLTLPKPNIFKGLVREKVCEICEKTSKLVKCKGCNGMFHVECALKETEVVETTGPTRGRKKKKKPRGRKPKNSIDGVDSEHSDERSQDLSVSEENNVSIEEIQEQENLVVDAEKFESQFEGKMQELLNAEIKYDLFLSDTDINWDKCVEGKCEIVDIKVRPKVVDTIDYSNFKCKHCQSNDTPLCFVCKSTVSPKEQMDHRQKCQFAHCYKYYHMECLDHWPQTQFSSGESSQSRKNPAVTTEAFTCPRHVCHTCVCDDPRGCKTRFSGDKLAKCVRCPATYHSFTKCLPAGTKILSASHIICPRHYEHRPGKVPCHVNTGWCFICALGGSLICCEFCPTSFHAECLNIKPPEGGYMCEDCETGRLPLYGEMVWVKLGHYRWWPGIVLHPSEIPENILAVKHSLGEFVVRFFGQYDYYWVNRGRVFPFQEGDSGRISSQKSKIDEAFTLAMEHAQRAFEILKNTEPNEVENQDIQSSLLPPHYVKLKVNRPCGSLYGKRVDVEESSLSQCECDPAEEDPCGPYSHCLNRMLLTECGPVCRAGERCNNRAFEKRQYPALAPYRTPHRGWGLHTLEDIKQGQFVIEYVGELIDEEEFQRRMRRKHEIRDENFYFLTLDKERMIDAGPKGNLARFMNHCCEPNCETQKWTVLGDVRVGLFALRDIPAQSEVTFNYNLECAGIEKKRCLCGAKRCAGYIGAKPKQDEPQARKGKLQAKRTYKKRKNIESPSTSANDKPKIKRPVGRPAKPRELTEIEKDLLIIKNATNGISSDSECSGRLSSIDTEGERKDKKILKRKVSFSSEDVTYDSSSPSLKRLRLDEDTEVGD